MDKDTLDFELTRINLAKGETLAITIKSDDIDSHIINEFRDSFKKQFPDNGVLIIGMSKDESIEFKAIALVE